METKRVTVWHDETSQEHGWIVDVTDSDGSTTVQVLDDEAAAREWARQYADALGLPMDNSSKRMAYDWAKREQGFQGTYADWLALPASEREQYELGAAGVPTDEA